MPTEPTYQLDRLPRTKQAIRLSKIVFIFVHVFVTILAVGCSKSGVPKAIEELNDSNPARKYAETYTENLNYEFQWKRFSYTGPWNSFDTTFYNDTAIAIEVINDTAIRFMGYTFEYIDSVYKTYGYEQYRTDTSRALVYANKSVQSLHQTESITYYYKANSLRYVRGSGGLGGSSAYILFTP